MMQISMLQYQRINSSTAESSLGSDFVLNQITSYSNKAAAQAHDSGLSNTGGVQIHHAEHSNASINSSSQQDMPLLRTTSMSNMSDGNDSADAKHSALPGQPLDSSSCGQSAPRPPCPPCPPAHTAAAAAPEDSAESGMASPPRHPSRAEAEQRGGQACFVCMDAAADAVLIECGHGGLCAGEAR